MKLSVIIPVYNEENTVRAIINRVLAVELPEKMELEILVVDDGSTDNTNRNIIECQRSSSVRMIRQQQNLGKTSAVARGIKEATGELIIIQDADLEYDPGQYPLLLHPILQGRADAVYGSRFLGQIRQMRPINRWANILSNTVFNLLYPVKLTDINTCYKLFRSEIVKPLTIESRHFTFETEITAKLIRQKRRIMEIPIHYVARTSKEGKKISWPKAISMFGGIFKYRF
ncbi:MAG: glycosyltransferase family 2 protein [Candidatus Omnitrophota bacterium]